MKPPFEHSLSAVDKIFSRRWARWVLRRTSDRGCTPQKMTDRSVRVNTSQVLNGYPLWKRFADWVSNNALRWAAQQRAKRRPALSIKPRLGQKRLDPGAVFESHTKRKG